MDLKIESEREYLIAIEWYKKGLQHTKDILEQRLKQIDLGKGIL